MAPTRRLAQPDYIVNPARGYLPSPQGVAGGRANPQKISRHFSRIHGNPRAQMTWESCILVLMGKLSHLPCHLAHNLPGPASPGYNLPQFVLPS